MARTARDPHRAAFAAAFANLQRAKANVAAFLTSKSNPIYEEFSRHLYNEARKQGASVAKAALFSSDHWQAQKFFRPEPFAELLKPFQARVDAASERLINERTLRETECRALAQPFTVLPGKAWHLFTQTHPGTYGSQTQPEHYAKTRAEVTRREIAELYGLTAELRTVLWEGTQWRRSAVQCFEVWAQVASALDLEALRYKPGFPIKQWAELCWKLGANPRVYNAFLPWHL